MKKRIVSFLLALVMAVSLLPVSAFAVEDTASPDTSAVAEPEVQTAEEQQGNDVAIEDNGIQTYADDKAVSIEFKKDSIVLSNEKAGTVENYTVKEIEFPNSKDSTKTTNIYVITIDPEYTIASVKQTIKSSSIRRPVRTATTSPPSLWATRRWVSLTAASSPAGWVP